jgi:hypothetical protein
MMNHKKVIFTDSEIVEFCKATKDTNELHNPDFMGKMGKRVIVPGMFALARTVNLSTDFLKSQASVIKVMFNSLLSSGDFVTLCTIPDPGNPYEVRLSAINHKDTLASKDDYARMFRGDRKFEDFIEGTRHRTDLDIQQVESFERLINATDPDVSNFLFAVAYTSKALLNAIYYPETEVEKEIDGIINRVTNLNSKTSPFYQSMELLIPSPFPVVKPGAYIDYFIHYQREVPCKLYTAHVRCEIDGKIIFHSQYKMGGIPDMVILRMAKDAHPHKNTIPEF